MSRYHCDICDNFSSEEEHFVELHLSLEHNIPNKFITEE